MFFQGQDEMPGLRVEPRGKKVCGPTARKAPKGNDNVYSITEHA